ncbi:MAG TPA: hypothetical protein VNE58_04795 [Casimicrobiaceae bacterium]|nr:hypothetical protein [Casimicrobiaceae bacterium]
MTGSAVPHGTRSRALALVIAALGLALVAYVEFAMTSASASDRFGWFVYEAGAWLLLLCVGPFLPIGRTVLVGACLALGLEAFAFYRVFVLTPQTDAAAIYLWKPLVQLVVIAATGFAGYLTYLKAQREGAHG